MEERPVPDAPDFELVSAEEEGRTVITVAGDLDIATAPGFEAAVRDALAAGPVVLDLGGLAFMDSSGVRALDALLRDGAPLTLRPELSELVRQVLAMTGLLEALPFEGGPPA
jgi:anti-anti-sigma factor